MWVTLQKLSNYFSVKLKIKDVNIFYTDITITKIYLKSVFGGTGLTSTS
jgi:hypothetical protein